MAAALQDQFDRLYAEGAKNPRVMAIAVHPYISGVPHRIKYFEAVYDYMRKQEGRVVHHRRGDLRVVEGRPALKT